VTDFLFEPPDHPALTIAGSGKLLPVHRVYCVGQNYAAHAREMGQSGRQPPFFFSKPADAVTQSPVVAFPPMTSNLHHEVELVVVIGSKASDVHVDSALDHVFGYAVGVDLTRRDLQAAAKEKARPWDVAKGFDQSAPISPVYAASDIGHLSEGRIMLSVDGVPRQQGNMADMIWSVPEVVAELSRFFVLRPGDLIFTGTPEGVGRLGPGANIHCEIEGLGSLSFSMAG
jgi:fumarylpyruvate hydrolase